MKSITTSAGRTGFRTTAKKAVSPILAATMILGQAVVTPVTAQARTTYNWSGFKDTYSSM